MLVCREVEMSMGFFLLLLLAFGLAVSVHGQSQTGFISIDCGAPENFNYVDIDTGISYTSDGSFINTGINKNISAEYAYPNNPTLPQPLSDLRAFPEGVKNCYTLRPIRGEGNLHLIRAYFLYGNYDGENKLPEFDLYLDVNLWFSVKFKNASDMVTTEIISVAASDTVDICLVNIGLGTPFISGLELRPLNGSIYNIESGTPGSLVLFGRWDIGYRNGSGRYNDDIYDRIWSPHGFSSSWESITTSSAIDVTGNGYKVPLEVMGTAGRPLNGSQSLELYWTTPDVNAQFYIYMHFAEVEILARNQSREFNVFWNGTPLFGPFSPRYRYAATMSNSKALVGQEHQISINRTGNSTLPPLLNAAELFVFKQSIELPTYYEDVEVINNVKSTYGINKNWVGDPCGPKSYSWEGLKCNYSDSDPPRIISLNLTSSKLSGGIDISIANLSSLETLDLSHNGLSGPVPKFLGELSHLKFLNLENNNLSGSVPATFLEKSKAGLLTLLVDDQNLCISDSCNIKKKKNIIVPIVASVSSTLVLFMVLSIIWRIRRKEKQGSNEEGKSLESKKKKFTFSEVKNMTNNFEKALGKGGFGTVYLGILKDGPRVAVKLLSSTSSQGSKEFQTEAELLMRVHHRNLASFVGYCDDNNNNLALVYEFMANGNLKDYLSDKTHTLIWEVRLRIAIDAAQGLEYLHHGCKPPIIHRDVKSANILLSENLDAKIADFGLSKVIQGDGQSHVSTTVMGTRGYLDPEYYISQKLTEKSDVYSFGIVLLELITGQPAIIKTDDHIHIVQWVIPMIERGEISSIVDVRLQGDYDVNSVWKALEVAMACTASTSLRRATMSFVLAELKECLAMELANKREARAKEEVMSIVQHSSNSTEVFSGDVASMTGPLAR